jgi:hypothetical protein
MKAPSTTDNAQISRVTGKAAINFKKQEAIKAKSIA